MPIIVAYTFNASTKDTEAVNLWVFENNLDYLWSTRTVEDL